jgi:hypothetical protein
MDRTLFYYNTSYDLPLQLQNYEWYQTEPNFLGDGTDAIAFSLTQKEFDQWVNSLDVVWKSGPVTLWSHPSEVRQLTTNPLAFTDYAHIKHLLIERTEDPSDGFEFWNATTVEIDTKHHWVRIIHTDM